MGSASHQVARGRQKVTHTVGPQNGERSITRLREDQHSLMVCHKIHRCSLYILIVCAIVVSKGVISEGEARELFKLYVPLQCLPENFTSYDTS